jgi:NAD(P)H dehydrogenase (quinone)
LLLSQSSYFWPLGMVADEAFIEGLSAAGVPEPAAREIASYGRAIREGYLREASDAVENLSGRPPRSLREVFEAHRHELQGVSA